jgi:transposase
VVPIQTGTQRAQRGSARRWFVKEGTSGWVANWVLVRVVDEDSGVVMEAEFYRVSDALWDRVAPLLPELAPRRFRYPGRLPADDRACLEGIVYVLRSGMPWRTVPRHDGRPCASACYRRFREWSQAGVWDRLHQVLVDELGAHGQVDAQRALVDSSLILAKKGAMDSGKARTIGADRASSATS